MSASAAHMEQHEPSSPLSPSPVKYRADLQKMFQDWKKRQSAEVIKLLDLLFSSSKPSKQKDNIILPFFISYSETGQITTSISTLSSFHEPFTADRETGQETNATDRPSKKISKIGAFSTWLRPPFLWSVKHRKKYCCEGKPVFFYKVHLFVNEEYKLTVKMFMYSTTSKELPKKIAEYFERLAGRNTLDDVIYVDPSLKGMKIGNFSERTCEVEVQKQGANGKKNQTSGNPLPPVASSYRPIAPKPVHNSCMNGYATSGSAIPAGTQRTHSRGPTVGMKRSAPLEEGVDSHSAKKQRTGINHAARPTANGRLAVFANGSALKLAVREGALDPPYVEFLYTHVKYDTDHAQWMHATRFGLGVISPESSNGSYMLRVPTGHYSLVTFSNGIGYLQIPPPGDAEQNILFLPADITLPFLGVVFNREGTGMFKFALNPPTDPNNGTSSTISTLDISDLQSLDGNTTLRILEDSSSSTQIEFDLVDLDSAIEEVLQCFCDKDMTTFHGILEKFPNILDAVHSDTGMTCRTLLDDFDEEVVEDEGEGEGSQPHSPIFDIIETQDSLFEEKKPATKVLLDDPEDSVTMPLCPARDEDYFIDEDIYQMMLLQEGKGEFGIFGSSESQQAITSLLPADYLRRRSIVVQWLADVCNEAKISSCTLFMAISYLDRMMAKFPRTPITQYQILAAVCLIIAAKQEEQEGLLTFQDMIVFMAQEKSKAIKEAMNNLEAFVLNSLDWKLSVITPVHFLVYYLNKVPTNRKSLLWEPKHFIEAWLLDKHNYVDKFSPSTLACAAVAVIANLDSEHWGKEFAQISGKSFSEIEPCCSLFAQQKQLNASTSDASEDY